MSGAFSRALTLSSTRQKAPRARRGIVRSAELVRIAQLPRRDLSAYDEAFAQALSQELRRPGASFNVKVKQAIMLVESVEAAGLLGIVGVGVGKTTIAPLFGKVMDVAPVVLLVPPAIKKEIQTRVLPWLHARVDFVQPIVVSYSELSTAGQGDLLDRIKPRLIVADECFADGTPVWTPRGLAPIEQLAIGDEVFAVDERSGLVTVERVMATRTRIAHDPVDVSVGGELLRTTGAHPFLTARGWKPAGELDEDPTVCLVHQNIHDLLQPFLRHELLGALEDESAENTREGTQREGPREDREGAARVAHDGRREGVLPSLVGSHDCAQSDALARDEGEAIRDAARDGAQAEVAGRQRPRDDASSVHAEVATWLAHGVRRRDRALLEGLPLKLQDRFGGPDHEDGRRGGWDVARIFESASRRSQEGRVFAFDWMAGRARAQLASDAERADGRRVHTIEVSGPSTYLVGRNGVVVHNCHLLKNKGAARTKRFLRYFADNPDTILVALSGTITRRSLMDFQHIIALTHKQWRCPVTRSWREAKDWSLALDPQVREDERLMPGALLELCRPGEGPRDGFRRRLVDTAGIVGGSAEDVGASLLFRKLAPAVPAAVERALADLRKKWETPGGEQITDALDFARKARELAQGFYYVWDWPTGEPDAEWLFARAEWRKAVANVCKLSRPGLDSELLVRNAAERACSGTGGADAARLPPAQRDKVVAAWKAWRAVKEREEPPVRAVWIDDFIVHAALQWARRAEADGEGGGLIWYEARAIEERARALGAFVCGAGSDGNADLLAVAERRGAPAPNVFVSSSAHGTGKNLQRWAKNLVIVPWAGGATWEQAIGRTHRPGQEADEVTVDVFVHTPELHKAIEGAMEQSRYIRDVTGGDQKMLQAAWVQG